MLTKTVRQLIRKEGWKNLKRRYYLNILVAFIFSVIISGGYQFATQRGSILDDNAFSTTASIVEAENGNGLLGKDTSRSNAETLRQFIFNIFEIEDIDDPDDIPTTSEQYYGGVASVFVNEISGSQSFVFGILNGVNQLVFGGKIASSITIFIFAVISIFIFLFFKNVIVVGKNRYFLEQRRYHGTGASELLFPYKNKRLKNIAFVMFFKYIYQVLWNLTIVGGIIKRYEYYLIPYLVAENPEITKKEAFELSKTLMHGEKWKCFILEASLFPWYILSYFTFNLSSLFFSDAYIECVRAEIYMQIRTAKKDSLRLGLRKLLNDDLLAIDHIEECEHPSGVEVMDIPSVSIHDLRYDYNRNYPFISLVQLFFTYSFVGWIWEVFYYVASIGKLVNRGTMHGPWLPIYGVGGILIILLLKPLRERPGLLFVGAVAVCGTVEYTTAWALETFLHKKWWDYTGFFLNIHGRVCFEGLLVFGMAGLAFTYVFSPMLDDIYKKVDIKYRRVVCIALLVLFAADLVWSVLSPNVGVGVTM